MYTKFNLSRTSIVILALVGTIICAVASLIAFEQWPAQNAAVRQVDTTQRQNDSSETKFKGGVDMPVELRVEETDNPLKQEMHEKLPPISNSGGRDLRLAGMKGHVGFWDAIESQPAVSTPGVEDPERERRGLEEEEKEARGDQPDEAARFRSLQLQDDDGKIPIDGLQKAREQVELMRARQQKKARAAGKPEGLDIAGINPGAWAWLGPGNIGGRIRTIVIDPTNTNKMFVGSVSGGIWRSTNAGTAWLPVNDFIANLAVSTMVIDPTNPNILYAGTGESFAADLNPTEGEGITPEGLRGDGVFKSTDGGTTWTQLQSTKTSVPAVCATAGPVCPWSYVNRLAMSPDGSTILAATQNGIYQSVDGGAVWNSRPAGLTRYPDIDFDPTNSQRAIAAGYGASVFSTNGGLNWQNATFTPPISNNCASGRVELAYAPSNPVIVYASVDENRPGPAPSPCGSAPYNPTTQGDIYKSIDGGATFTLVNASNPGNTFLGAQGNYGNIIWVNPNDPNFLVVGGINMYESPDGGLNWTSIANGSNGSAHSDHHMIVADPGFNNNTNKKVYFSNDGGIYRADDVSSVSLTSGWTKLNNSLGVTQFYGAAVNAAGAIVGGTQDNGTLRYTGDAQAWTSMFGGDGGFTAADPADNNYFYGEYTNLGIVRSTNAGSSSGYIYCNPVNLLPSGQPNGNGGACVSPSVGITDAFNGANFIAPFILDPNEPNRMLAGGLSLWRSNDIKAAGLPTWSPVKNPAPDRRPAPRLGQANPISAIAVSKNNSDFILVGHNDGQLYLTFDGTSAVPTWSRIDSGIPSQRFVTRLVIDETRSPNWIYATLGGFAGDNIYRSIDLGATWTDVTGAGATGLPNVPVRDLAISPGNPTNLYAATEIGIFASDNAGATWGLPQDGPANVAVDQLIWINGNLGAVTHGRGVYKTNTPVYSLPICSAPPGCTCFGNWDCPCSWSSGTVPTADSDVTISCPITVRAANAIAKNMVVTSFLFLENDLGVTGDVFNRGQIKSLNGNPSNFGGRNIVNYKNPNTFNNGGEILLFGSLTATGDITNSGSGVIAVGQAIDSVNFATNTGSTATMTTLNVRGNLNNFGLIQSRQAVNVKGNITNDGSLTGMFLVPTAPASLVKTYSGSGLWNFGAFSIPIGYNIKLGSDLTFDIPSVSNSGVFDFSDKTLNVKGDSFQGIGTVAGTGTLRFIPATGFSVFNANGPAVTVASGTVEYQSGGTISGPLTIDAGATLAMNTGGILQANNNVTVNGSITKTGANPQFAFDGQTFTNNGTVGNIDFFTFNDGTGPPVQFVSGVGSWSPTNISVGAGTSTTLNLGTNVNFTTNQLIIATNAALYVGTGLTLAMTGPTNFFLGKITGTGLVKMQPASGSPRMGTPFAALTIDPAVEIASGIVRATTLVTNGKLTIDPGATLSLLGFVGIEAKGDVENNGTLNAFSDNPSFKFKGGTFTNNGNVTGNVYVNFGDFFGPPLVQNLAGAGSWVGSPRLLVDALSTTTLLNDFTYNGGNLWVEGRLNTGAFTLSLPCNVPWNGAGDVIGSIRRTNLAACPGAIFAFGNPFTTIQFTSGIPPTDITVNVGLTAPAGFPGAATRTYLITPTGGNAYTATLRLHYLDSELNGNAESTLQLWRNNGSNWTPQGATNRNTTQNWVEYAGVTQFSPWTISGPSAPTAASVSVSGQVRTADGTGIRNAIITLTARDGSTRIARSSSFGYYQFDNVTAGETYILSISAKRFSFSQPTIVIGVLDDIAGLDFVGGPLP